MNPLEVMGAAQEGKQVAWFNDAVSPPQWVAWDKTPSLSMLASAVDNGYQIAVVDMSAVEAEVWPKKGDEYWHVDGYGDIYVSPFCDDDIDQYSLSTNNCHRTKKAAEAHRAYQMDPRVRARELVELCEGFDVVGCEEIMAEEDKVLIPKHLRLTRYWGSPRFKSGYAQAAIDKLGEPLIKVALGLIIGDEAEAIVREAVGRV